MASLLCWVLCGLGLKGFRWCWTPVGLSIKLALGDVTGVGEDDLNPLLPRGGGVVDLLTLLEFTNVSVIQEQMFKLYLCTANVGNWSIEIVIVIFKRQLKHTQYSNINISFGRYLLITVSYSKNQQCKNLSGFHRWYKFITLSLCSRTRGDYVFLSIICR